MELENFIEKTHQDCFNTSFFYKKHFFELKPSASEANFSDVMPTVMGCVSSDENWLDVTFILQNTLETIDTPNFHLANAIHTDYLWEQNCLELFVRRSDTHYHEINASLNGKFAVYRFVDYRNPASMPPRKSTDVTFQWRNVQIGLALVYQFSLLFSPQADFSVENVTCINPCAILYTGNNPLFYAVNHANPPDFHDKKYWLKF